MLCLSLPQPSTCRLRILKKSSVEALARPRALHLGGSIRLVQPTRCENVPSTRKYEADIAAAKQRVDWKTASLLVKEASMKQVPLTAAMFSDVIYTIGFGGARAAVLTAVITVADDAGVKLDVGDLDLAALVFARDGEVKRACAMSERVDAPSLRTLYALADMSKRCADASAVDYVLKKAYEARLDDPRLFGACITALAAGGQFDRAIEELKNLPPEIVLTASVYTALIRAAEVLCEDELAAELTEEMNAVCTEW